MDPGDNYFHGGQATKLTIPYYELSSTHLNKSQLWIFKYRKGMSSLVQNISDTARWVAVFRAEESERPDAVFHDPFARKLAGEKGEQIADAIGFGRDNSW